VGIFFQGGIYMNEVFERSARFEHRFWLQIVGDHSRFIFEALAPIQKVEIEMATNFINIFDALLERAKSSPLTQLTAQVEPEVLKLREFKLDLIRKHLVGKIKIHLSPTFINHMVNELEEYVRILNQLKEGKMPPIYHELHHHLLWLLDAAGHSDAIYSNLDGVEKKLRKKSKTFKKDFEGFYLKAVELAGYLRTNLTNFPALTKMTNDAQLEIKLFQNFLTELEELELSNQALGTFAPLMADHMYREECYYLMKLAESANIDPPNCDPAKPRLKE
jgi:predicted nucleotide-binding protein (sugar kinase/HSP70/actin superfamily)